jgi:hypothetical protein
VTRFAALGPLLLAVAACNVTEVPAPPSSVAINACDSNDVCAGGSCIDGACFAGASELGSMLVEITPPPGSVLPQLPYYASLGDTPGDDILIQPPATVTGYVTLHPDSCTPTFLPSPGQQYVPAELTIPVQVTLTASARTLGLPTRSYRAELIVASEELPRHHFKVLVPPGDYDVYIEPMATTPECQIPPWLFLKQRISTSGPFDVKLSKTSSVTVPVHWPTASLDNFAVELLDTVSGRVLSAPAKLSNPGNDEEGRALYRAAITYSRVLGLNAMNEPEVSAASYELVRISPPEGTTAPSIMGALSAIGDTDKGGFLQSVSLPSPVVVEAQTAEAGTTTSVPAAVTVTATRIEGMDLGLFGAFTRTYQVDDD